MSVVRIAVPKSPKRIRVTDSDALLEHANVLQLRSRLHDLIDQAMRPAEQRVEEARLKLREAEVAAVGLGDDVVREGRASPHLFDPSRCRENFAAPEEALRASSG